MEILAEIMSRILRVVAVALAILIPLAIWKLIEIIIWFFKHISISWG